MPRVKCRPLPELTEEIKKQILARIARPDGPTDCWPWMGGRTSRGYGTFPINYQIYYVTRLIWLIETGEDPFPLEMRHNCDNPPCSRFAHLLTGTHQENMQDAVERKRMALGLRNGVHTHPEKVKHGEANPAAKLTNQQVEYARIAVASGRSCAELARELNISPAAIVQIVHGSRRKDAPGPIADAALPRSGENAPTAVLTGEKVRLVLVRRAEGAVLHELCAEFGVTQGAIVPILDGSGWKHISREGLDLPARKRQTTTQQQEEIRSKRAAGISVRALALEYNMSIGAIYAILLR